jgi:hypothetical protein
VTQLAALAASLGVLRLPRPQMFKIQGVCG